jgi:hypothetical protein
MNQSQYGDNQSPEEIQAHKRQDFSPEIPVLAGTLVPIVSTNTWWFGG